MQTFKLILFFHSFKLKHEFKTKHLRMLFKLNFSNTTLIYTFKNIISLIQTNFFIKSFLLFGTY